MVPLMPRTPLGAQAERSLQLQPSLGPAQPPTSLPPESPPSIRPRHKPPTWGSAVRKFDPREAVPTRPKPCYG